MLPQHMRLWSYVQAGRNSTEQVDDLTLNNTDSNTNTDTDTDTDTDTNANTNTNTENLY